ncbi:hypothetical protein [Ramlibacter sp. WS9]|uniref:ATP-binding protein n=1 Tax=Ramlibacter sp. WS9 TaxID=1882741 RepID=UPI0011413D5B|nr:hypothetical protein [Ramlibacter sp. WS9]ROZ76467.1 hypothetical protein EEB15_11440 [Ramlibacter sp. WS9]
MLRIARPARWDAAKLDGWLARSFGVEPGPVPIAPEDDEAHALMRAFTWRALHLGTALLRAVKIPALAPCRILAIAGGPNIFEVRFAAPRIDRLSPEVPGREAAEHKAHEFAFGNAVRTLHGMCALEEAPQATAHAHDELQQSFVKTLDAMVQGGGSTVPLLQAAFSLDIPFRHLSAGVFQLGWGSAARRVDRGAIQFDSAIGARMGQDKAVSVALMRDAGLPVPAQERVPPGDDGTQAARRLGWPVVVKPADRDRGEGVTVDIVNDARLASAIAQASKFSRRVLMERQVTGVCHRVVVAANEVLLVSKRLPKLVRGDGVHSVAQLVARANEEEMAKPPWTRLKPFPLDEVALACLAQSGLSPSSVPPEGHPAPLRRIQSSAEGGVVEDWTDRIHPDNVEIALKAARLFGFAIAGIDIISQDISRPWHENGAVLNEVNYSSLLPSRLSAHVLPILLRKFFAADGRIPVDLVMGGPEAAAEGLRLRAAHAEAGLRCCMAGHERVVAADGKEMPVAAQGLFGRTLALLLDPDVDALVLVVQTDELLRTGLPVDRINRVVETADAAGAPWLGGMRELIGRYRTEAM